MRKNVGVTFSRVFGAIFFACMLLTSSANAQGGSSGSYGSSGSAVASYSGSAVGSYAGYGSSGSAVVGYGSNGSAAAAYDYSNSKPSSLREKRPLRSILENKPIRSRVQAVLQATPVRSTIKAVASVPTTVGNAYQVALASAQLRASTRRKGHAMSIEAGYTTGVGFSTFDPTPSTCFGVGGNYAVVRGADGWYSTKVL